MKKMLSMLLAAALVLTVVSIGAVSVAAAADAPEWQQKSDGKIYFYADARYWKNYNQVTCFLYERDGGELITWGSKKGKMTAEGGDIWSFDPAAMGISFDSDGHYGVIFTADWSMQTIDLIIGEACLGDMAYIMPNEMMTGNPVDCNKQSYKAAWCNADPTVYGIPIVITSIGNVIGDVFWNDQNARSVMTQFLLSTDSRSIFNAVTFNGKTYRETAEDTAAALGMTVDELEALANELHYDLDDPEMPAPSWYGVSFYETDDVFPAEGTVYAFIYDEDGNSFFEWGSQQCAMEKWDTANWAYYFSDGTIQLDPDKTYYVIFTLDWNYQTNPLELDDLHRNGTVYLTGNILSGSDGQTIYEAEWEEYDPMPTPGYDWEKRDDNKVYFYADPDLFGESDSVTATVSYYDFDTNQEYLVSTLSMQKEPEENVWSCEVPAEALAASFDMYYSIAFTLNGFETESVFLDRTVLGDLAFPVLLDGVGNLAFLPIWCNPTYIDPVWGDLDGDEELTIQDVTLLQRYLAEFSTADGEPLLSEYELWLADLNGDGAVNISDATDMQRAIAELYEF